MNPHRYLSTPAGRTELLMLNRFKILADKARGLAKPETQDKAMKMAMAECAAHDRQVCWMRTPG